MWRSGSGSGEENIGDKERLVERVEEASAVDPGFAVVRGGGGWIVVVGKQQWAEAFSLEEAGFFRIRRGELRFAFEAGPCGGDCEVNNWTASVLTRHFLADVYWWLRCLYVLGSVIYH